MIHAVWRKQVKRQFWRIASDGLQIYTWWFWKASLIVIFEQWLEGGGKEVSVLIWKQKHYNQYKGSNGRVFLASLRNCQRMGVAEEWKKGYNAEMKSETCKTIVRTLSCILMVTGSTEGFWKEWKWYNLKLKRIFLTDLW